MAITGLQGARLMKSDTIHFYKVLTLNRFSKNNSSFYAQSTSLFATATQTPMLNAHDSRNAIQEVFTFPPTRLTQQTGRPSTLPNTVLALVTRISLCELAELFNKDKSQQQMLRVTLPLGWIWIYWPERLKSSAPPLTPTQRRLI